MATMVSFQNEAGLVRRVKVGFSWTAFFFGGFPFLFRGLGVQFVIWTIASMATFGLSNLVLWFIINKLTAHKYLEMGYRPIGPDWDKAAMVWGVALPGNMNQAKQVDPPEQAQAPAAAEPTGK